MQKIANKIIKPPKIEASHSSFSGFNTNGMGVRSEEINK
jgi:hypothetical protein